MFDRGRFLTKVTGDNDLLFLSASVLGVLIISGMNTCTKCTGSVHCALPSDLTQWCVVQISLMILQESTPLLISVILSESESSPESNSGSLLLISNMSCSRGLGASMLQFVGVFKVCGWIGCSF